MEKLESFIGEENNGEKVEAEESSEELANESEPLNCEELSEQEFKEVEEGDEQKTEEIRKEIKNLENRKNYEGPDVERLMEIPEKISLREKVKQVEESGSFDEKFELLEELKMEKFKFEIKGFVNNLSQILVDSSSTKEKRGEFVADIVKAIGKAFEDGRLPENFFEGVRNMISVGSGHGENPFGILKEYMPESRAILIDPDAAPSRAIAEDGRIMHLGQRFEDVKIEVVEGEKNLVEASNFLQLYDEDGKIEMVKKMIRLAGAGGKIIIVDEINRGKLTERITDKVLNKIYNPGQKKYECMDPGDYEGMFKDLGLKCYTSCETDQYNRGSVLFMLEVTQEAMDMAMEENSVQETEE